MNREIIFIGGIHGVGKTTLTQKVALELGGEHFSAGELIKMFENESNENIKDKRVTNISGNQEVLISAINHFIKENSVCLLDGHFCLLNRDNEVTEVPQEIFLDISPLAIVVLYDSVAEISQKIGKRDNQDYDLDLLSRFQLRELEYSQQIAELLSVPYLAFDVKKGAAVVTEFIKELKTRM